MSTRKQKQYGILAQYSPLKGSRPLRLALLVSLSAGVATSAVADTTCGPEQFKAVAQYFSHASAQAPANYQSAYLNYPSRSIAAADKPFPLPLGTPLGNVSYQYADKPSTLDDFLKATRSHGLLVLHKGRIVREQYANGGTEQTRFLLNSMTKSLVGLSVGIAVDQGLISSLDDPISHYLPELKEGAYQTATVRQVLDMTTALHFAGQSPDAAGRGRDIEATASKSFGCGQSIRQHPVNALFNEGSQHGQAFTYINTNTQVLGALVERVSGTSLSKFMERNLWSRIGTEDAANWLIDQPDDSKAIEHAWMGFNARVRDLGRLGLLLANNGEWQGKQLISKSWIHDSMTPDQPFLKQLAQRPVFGYSHQWWVPVGGKDEFIGMGFGGQYLYVNQAEQLVIVEMSANPTFDSRKSTEEAIAVFRAVAANLAQE
ncbi:serine hydrolase domain-containing protein [Pseudomonas sp. NPDC090755]|uniref:serine hydrolase domain-containing protein n=1 Tax=Pseudomonas sp. NPDC090755 TaxID=3364481 RepID=UPI00383B111F